MQERINMAALTGGDWTGIPDTVRAAADTPWFQSVLEYDPARLVRDLRQPLLIVHGELDTEVRPLHADRLAEMANARRRKAATEVAKVPGVNHLLVLAQTGRVDEYATLSNERVSTAVTSAIATWLARILG
jgi:pimeloyl-ACP methyl ester carboxylesterase